MLADFLLGPFRPAGADGDGDVLEGGEPRQQRVALENDGLLERGPGDFLAVHNHASLGGLVEAGEDVEDGGFSTTGMAEAADKLTLLEAEVDVFKDDGGSTTTGGGREATGEFFSAEEVAGMGHG